MTEMQDDTLKKTKNRVKIRRLAVLVGILCVFFVVSAAYASEVANVPEQLIAAGDSSQDGTKPADDEQERIERRKFKIAMSICIVAIVLFFLMILLLTILRHGRFYRQRIKLGKKNEPTEYVDAWSRYRLDEHDELE